MNEIEILTKQIVMNARIFMKNTHFGDFLDLMHVPRIMVAFQTGVNVIYINEYFCHEEQLFCQVVSAVWPRIRG